MTEIKKIQTLKLDQTVDSPTSWVMDWLVPGKDQIDVCYDEGSDLFIYGYRGQSDYDVATIRVEEKGPKFLEEGPIRILSTLQEKRFLGNSMVCTLLDENRGVIVTILKGASSGGIAVAPKK